MKEFLRSLDQIDRDEYPQAGGKGYALAQLLQADFPVPPGFVITTQAYRAFTTATGLDSMIQVLRDDGTGSVSTQIRAAFERATMPSIIASAVCKAYLDLQTDAVAVRSSAVSEDSETASFAGQYDTMLNVIGCGPLLSAVRCCWASLWGEQALAYRRHLGSRERPLAMAVIVQQMVPAAHAGVAFTLDPISGRRDVVIIESVTGAGETLVGGRTTPERYMLEKRKRPRNTTKGGLDAASLKRISELAQQVEKWAGQPQDIEWALDAGGQIYLLQARPITAAGPIEQGAVTHWTRDNVGEVVPDPVTPLSWSVLDPLANRSFASVMRRLGVSNARVCCLLDRFNARVYLNQTLFQSTIQRFYISRAGWRALPRMAVTTLRSLLSLIRLPAESKNAMEAILAQRQMESRLNLAACSSADVLDRLAGWHRLEMDAMKVHLAVTVVAELLYQALDKLLARWYRGPITAAVLMSGLTGIHSAEAGQALASIAQQVRQDARLRSLVVEASAEVLPAELARTEKGRALWARIQGFLAEYGHGAAQEFELAAPRWRDNPATVLRALQAQVRAEIVVAGSPSEEQGQAPDYATAVAQVKKQLGMPQSWVFRLLLHRVRIFASARENLKYHFVLAHGRLRDLYLTLAAQLVRAEQLESTDDAFFLTDKEVIALAEERMTFEESRNCVKERRAAWVAEQSIEPPFAFDQLPSGVLHPTPPAVQFDEQDGCLLRGFAASAGSYTGRARVMSLLDGDRELGPGEVLVARAITPGWAPTLLSAGALVTEIGGVLSHGAIIAREYGLPAVMNVVGATHHIATGQLIHVDGYRGLVHLVRSTEE